MGNKTLRLSKTRTVLVNLLSAVATITLGSSAGLAARLRPTLPSGIVETVDSSVAAVSSGTPIITYLDDKLISEIMRSLNDLADVGIEPPYAVLVSLIGVAGAQLDFARGEPDPFNDNISDGPDRDQYHFDEVIFETIPTDPARLR